MLISRGKSGCVLHIAGVIIDGDVSELKNRLILQYDNLKQNKFSVVPSEKMLVDRI